MIEKEIVLGNKLPPFCFHDSKRQRMDVGSFQHEQAARLDSFRHGRNESLRRIDVFDNMKAGDHIEISPWQRFDDVSMNRSRIRSALRQIRVRLDAIYFK